MEIELVFGKNIGLGMLLCVQSSLGFITQLISNSSQFLQSLNLNGNALASGDPFVRKS